MSTSTESTAAHPEIDAGAAEHLRLSLATMQSRNHRVLLKLVEGIDQQASVTRLFEAGGNVNWLLGHLATSRDDLLESLGAERLMAADADARYGSGSHPEAGVDTAPLESLLVALERANQRVLEEIGKLDHMRLAQTDERGRRLLDRLEFGPWHEAYHPKQVTLYRKNVGLTSPIG